MQHPLLEQHRIKLRVLRLDQIHPTLSGNKWFKLKYNLEAIQQQGITRVLSFGGAYSNHIRALAAAGKCLDLETIGLIRGELVEPLNPILAFAQQQGMQLIGVSRSEYRRKQQPMFLQQMRSRFGEFYLLPEGGSNRLAVAGCREIADYFSWQTTSAPRFVALACGTGATMSGIVLALAESRLQPAATVLGVSVLKAQGYIAREVSRWLHSEAGSESSQLTNWQVLEDYHCGGYARTSSELQDFLRDFADYSSLPLEPVYTGKLFFGLFQMIRQGGIPADSEIIAIHSGGVY